jgi:hypothetical protein
MTLAPDRKKLESEILTTWTGPSPLVRLSHFGAAWCFLVLQECFRDTPEVLRRCCGDAVVMLLLRRCYSTMPAALLLVLGAKQGQDVYFRRLCWHLP